MREAFSAPDLYTTIIPIRAAPTVAHFFNTDLAVAVELGQGEDGAMWVVLTFARGGAR